MRGRGPQGQDDARANESGSSGSVDGPVYRVVVSSEHVLRDGLDERCANLAALISGARQRAVRQETAPSVAGALALHGGRLYLALEGVQAEAEAYRDRVADTFRHLDARVLWQGEVPGRRLPRHPLLFVSGDPRAQDRFSQVLAASEPAADQTEAIVDALAQASARLEASAETRAPDPGASGRIGDVPAPADGAQATRTEARPETRTETRTGAWPDAEAQALDAAFGSAVLAADGTFLRANAAFAALFGFTPDALAGRPYTLTLHETDDSHLARLWAAMARGETVRIDRRGRRRDGVEIWLRSTYRSRLDAAGGLRDVTEIAVEITREKLLQLDERGQIAAIDRAQAVVHFDLTGSVIAANDRFLAVMGYARGAVIGRHHRMFVEAAEAGSPDYAAFWRSLAAGEHRSGEFKRVAGDGRAVWLQATYHPILDMGGRPFKVVKYAVDVTAEKLMRADYQWQIAAIHKSHAVVTFDMNGIVLDANDIFLEAVGYARDEVIGHHHRMFVDENDAHGAEYAEFWRALGRGLHRSGQYKRLSRDGVAVWLQATYNPIFDTEGRPFKVVKYATIVTDEKLRQAEQQSQIAAIHKAQAVVAFALDGTILDANRNFLETMGYRLGEVRGRHHRMFVAPSQAEGAAYAAFWSALAAGRHQGGEFKRVGRDGREIWLQATYNPIFDMDGRPFRVVKYAIDVTAEKLRQAEIDGQLAAIQTSQGVVTFALDGTILDANDGFLATLGYARAEIVGQHHSLLVDPDHAAAPEYAAFWDTLRAGTFLSNRYRRRGKGGREVWIQATYNPILGLDGKPFRILELATDVTGDVALAEAFQDAQRQAQHDATTALPNRVRLASHMAAALANPNGRVVVFYLDLDRFKPINDAFGHHVGDRVLGEVADRLRRMLAPDQLAARVGGDEFVVVAPDLPDDAIEAFGQTLLDGIAAPIPHEAGDLVVGASIGIAVAPLDGDTPDALLRAADTALYRAKQGGRGTFSFYTASMNERVLAYRSLVDDIRRGLAAGQFFLEYQPRFEARARRIRSAEALVRWAHPDRGQLAPAEFIPLAEKSGLIVPLGEWVLRTACRAATDWPGIGVSVNVSPVQIRGSDFVGLVADALAESGLEPHRLELELTENVLLEDAPRAGAALEGLKRLGVRLAMDDFGTGYASLSSLKNFPFDVLKIDRQFIADMRASAAGEAVIRAILALGSSLGLSVTAEGVETSDQLRLLVEQGCDEVQGFHLARPISARAVSDLLAAEALPAGRPAGLAAVASG